MTVPRRDVDVILRSLGYIRPSLRKLWQPNKPMKLGSLERPQRIGRTLSHLCHIWR